jgi:hypothetical protein
MDEAQGSLPSRAGGYGKEPKKNNGLARCAKVLYFLIVII